MLSGQALGDVGVFVARPHCRQVISRLVCQSFNCNDEKRTVVGERMYCVEERIGVAAANGSKKEGATTGDTTLHGCLRGTGQGSLGHQPRRNESINVTLSLNIRHVKKNKVFLYQSFSISCLSVPMPACSLLSDCSPLM